ncbi:MAG: hypothetical protein RL538_369 [Candidatus Parcubacteria bacterium]
MLRHSCQSHDSEGLASLAQQVGQVHRITDGYFDESSAGDVDFAGTNVEDYDLDTGSSRRVRRRNVDDSLEGDDLIPRRTGRHRDLTELIR